MEQYAQIATGMKADLVNWNSSSTACEVRGFHGPFETGGNAGEPEGLAACKVCGSWLSVADHAPAYQIARFHGLTP